jgi:hypothetical protein
MEKGSYEDQDPNTIASTSLCVLAATFVRAVERKTPVALPQAS